MTARPLRTSAVRLVHASIRVDNIDSKCKPLRAQEMVLSDFYCFFCSLK
ncbi:hypothetical protein ig2599ANME_0860 [groundwater metagenome]